MKSYNKIIAENKAWAEEIFAKVDTKLQKVTLRSRNLLADACTSPDHTKHVSVGAPRWISGFWGATNALMYCQTKNEEYLKTANRSEELLDEVFDDFELLYHDVGFMWHILSGAVYRMTGNAKSKNRNLLAAASLSSRYVLSGGFIRAWNDYMSKWDGRDVTNFSIIDCMMNLPILYWASDVIGDDRFKQIAMAHADMALRDHLRDDGSLYHIVDHDRATGLPVYYPMCQGLGPETSWSRGQAWGLYGFTLSYIHTGEKRYLDAAKKIANYFIAACCDDWLPRCDFRSPDEPVIYDSSAGLCAACGLLELAKRLPEDEGGMYANGAVNMIRAICENFADFNEDTDPIIGWGTMRYPVPGRYTEKSAGVNRPLNYSDFFFVEALLKMMGNDFLPW